MKKKLQHSFLTKPLLFKSLLVLVALVCSLQVHAGSYSVAVGSSKNIYCTATAPAGYITHAFYSLADPNDAEYVALYSHSEEQYATIVGLQAKANIKVEVTYAYTYTGSYDHSLHVGHGTYYDYITVTGGTKPTAVKIVEGDVSMLVGETIELHAQLTPSNASTTFAWGYASPSSKPYNFDMSYIGGKATVTAKGEGKLYVVCQTANDLYAGCIVTAKKSNEPPTAIEMNDAEMKIEEGTSKTLTYKLTPVTASTTVSWTSSDENVATVSSSGRVKAIAHGTAIIKATTENGLTAETKVIVPQKIEQLSLPADLNLTLGFSDKLTPSFSPSNAEGTLTWKSSNTSKVTVDADGVVQGKQLGTAEIEVKTAAGVSAKCQVTVVAAEKGLDHRNIQSRINEIQKLNQKVLENNRK